MLHHLFIKNVSFFSSKNNSFRSNHREMENNSPSASKIQRLSIDDSLENKERKITMDELDGEYVLQHLMHNVCQYLNMYDLCHVAQVCK